MSSTRATVAERRRIINAAHDAAAEKAAARKAAAKLPAAK